MTHVEAFVPTAHAARYAQQLARHWAHKFPVEAIADHTRIDLPLGRCALSAASDGLTVVLEGADGADMARFQHVVAEHLQRFGHRESLQFDWRSETRSEARRAP